MTTPATPQFDPSDSIFVGEVPDDDAVIDGVVPGDVRSEVGADGHLTATVPTGDVDLYDHSAEQDAIRQHQQSLGVAPPEMPATEPEPIRNPAMMQDSSDPIKQEMERRFRQEFGDISVEVTPTERDAFVRAALHDEELIWDIELPGLQVAVKVAIPSEEFTNSASAAVNHWGRIDFIDKDSDLQWLLSFQQIHAWCQIRAIGGEPTAWSDFWADGLPGVKALREAMRNPDTFDAIFTMNAARWKMCLEAIRIAEMKYKLCLQNWRDRSFFAGAGID